MTSAQNQPANVTSLALGLSHTCALLSQGSVSCWGDNTYGQVCLTHISGFRDCLCVAVVSSDVFLSVPHVSLRCVHASFLLVRDCSWSRCNDPQLGWTSSSINASNVRLLPRRSIRGLSGVAAITAGWYSNCAVLTNSSLRCWGANSWGQLGKRCLIHSLLSSPRSSPLSRLRGYRQPCHCPINGRHFRCFQRSLRKLLLLFAVGHWNCQLLG